MIYTRFSELLPQIGKYTGSLIYIKSYVRFSSSHFDSWLKKEPFRIIIRKLLSLSPKYQLFHCIIILSEPQGIHTKVSHKTSSLNPLVNMLPIRNHKAWIYPKYLYHYLLNDYIFRLQISMNDSMTMNEQNCFIYVA